MPDIDTAGIGVYLKNKIDSFFPAVRVSSCGTVKTVGDGVVRIDDLTGCQNGELVEFSGGVYGMALDIEENHVGAVLLGAGDSVRVGDRAMGTGRVCSVPVGENLDGRIIDPIGRALDGKPLEATKFYPVERPAPLIMMRRPVGTPLETGIISIDTMIPIGRGQRELIIGDRQTGKTSIALSAILSQKGKGVHCVYCAIGQKASTVAEVTEFLRQTGALSYTTVVVATASDSPAMQYLAPYAACSVAEYYRDNGSHALVIYDDLSKHAVAYRTMSLLLHRSPGREAYPGDIFYLHSRLLERAACMSLENGGGTLTAIPVIETTGGNISAYIPTNVISITDGQIYLEPELFHNGIRPAVNTGLSVSRVGRAAQPKAMKKLSGTLRIDLSQYREMAVFARFGTDLDDSTKKQLSRGEMLTMLMTQGKNTAYSVADKTAILIGYKLGYFDEFKPKTVVKEVASMLAVLRESIPEIMSEIDRTGDFTDEQRTEIEQILKK